MGIQDLGGQPEEPEIVRLQRESQELLTQLKTKLDELDVARARAKGRHASPQERRLAFRVIQGGGAVVAAAAVWAWETARRPAVAVAAGTGTVATGAFVAAPMVNPGTADADPPIVVETTEMAPSEVEPTVVVLEQGDDVGSGPVPLPPPTLPPPAELPTAGQSADSGVAPTATVTASPTSTPTGLVEVEVYAEDRAACVESGLVGLELAACING